MDFHHFTPMATSNCNPVYCGTCTQITCVHYWPFFTPRRPNQCRSCGKQTHTKINQITPLVPSLYMGIMWPTNITGCSCSTEAQIIKNQYSWCATKIVGYHLALQCYVSWVALDHTIIVIDTNTEGETRQYLICRLKLPSPFINTRTLVVSISRFEYY